MCMYLCLLPIHTDLFVDFAALDCKSDVLTNMTLMEKITPALLLSAQSVIAKEIETKW